MTLIDTESRLGIRPEETGAIKGPVFDVDLAGRARGLVGERFSHFGIGGHEATRLAMSLGFYNEAVEGYSGFVREWPNRFAGMLNDEQEAASLTSPFPTMGVEVEIPLGKHPAIDYTAFAEAIGIPGNKSNDEIDSSYTPGEWEFGSPPSYSASSQNALLLELMRGKFIPSLSARKDTPVSLHVNLGVPEDIRKRIEDHGFVISEDVRILSTAFALGFSSPRRLLTRTEDSTYFKSGAVVMEKPASGRLELRAFEVKDFTTPIMLTEMQYMGAALFSYLARNNDRLHRKWLEVKRGMETIAGEHGFDWGVLENKPRAAQLAAQPDLKEKIRILLHSTTNDIKEGIEAKYERD